MFLMLVQVVRICLNIKTLYCIWQLVTGGLTGLTTLLLSQGILAEIHVILVSFKWFFIGYFGLLLLYYRQQANFTTVTTFVVLACWCSGNLSDFNQTVSCSRLGWSLHYCFVSWQTKNFAPHCLSSPRCINAYRRHTAGGNPAMDYDPFQQGVEILPVTSCHINRVGLQLRGPFKLRSIDPIPE